MLIYYNYSYEGLLGDSGVGKTSFVQRFCNSSFNEAFNTTIGVDFQVKSITVDNKMYTLQFWDTVMFSTIRKVLYFLNLNNYLGWTRKI
jgi:GTPase SAR1 family protein